MVIFLVTVPTPNLAIGVPQAPEDPGMTDIVMTDIVTIDATDTNNSLSLSFFFFFFEQSRPLIAWIFFENSIHVKARKFEFLF